MGRPFQALHLSKGLILSIDKLKHSSIGFDAELGRHAVHSLLEILDLLRPIVNLCLPLSEDGLPVMLIHLTLAFNMVADRPLKGVSHLE